MNDRKKERIITLTKRGNGADLLLEASNTILKISDRINITGILLNIFKKGKGSEKQSRSSTLL